MSAKHVLLLIKREQVSPHRLGQRQFIISLKHVGNNMFAVDGIADHIFAAYITLQYITIKLQLHSLIINGSALAPHARYTAGNPIHCN